MPSAHLLSWGLTVSTTPPATFSTRKKNNCLSSVLSLHQPSSKLGTKAKVTFTSAQARLQLAARGPVPNAPHSAQSLCSEGQRTHTWAAVTDPPFPTRPHGRPELASLTCTAHTGTCSLGTGHTEPRSTRPGTGNGCICSVHAHCRALLWDWHTCLHSHCTHMLCPCGWRDSDTRHIGSGQSLRKEHGEDDRHPHSWHSTPPQSVSACQHISSWYATVVGICSQV